MAEMTLDRLRATFAMIPDWEERYRVIIDLARKLEPLPAEAQNEDNLVKGCMSQVWMTASTNDDGTLHILADSDAIIVKGLIGVLMLIYNNKSKADILASDPIPTFAELGLDQHISPNRQNGLHSMVGRIKGFAAT